MKFIFLLFFIGVPIAEIATFIKVGTIVGLWPTIATIILTALIGASLIRIQGLKTLADAQAAAQAGRVPIDAVIEGVFLLIAALLLLTPGFLTDAFGFLLLWRPFRLSIAKWLWVKVKTTTDIHMTHGQRPTGARQEFKKDGPIIEGNAISPDERPDPEGEKTPAKKFPGSKSP